MELARQTIVFAIPTVFRELALGPHPPICFEIAGRPILIGVENPYLQLTEAFNDGRLRAVLSSGQAVVVHRLAIMSKDGDWILREDDETCRHVLSVLAEHASTYRFGAPLDVRWLAGGWSAHLEHRAHGIRLRTDFVSRPPRLSPVELERVWLAAQSQEIPTLDLEPLAEIKKTNREKDYAVIGELARKLEKPESQLLYSRSARDLIRLGTKHPDLVEALSDRRPLLLEVEKGREAVERALDAERRVLMHLNEERLARYVEAAKGWSALWPSVREEIAHLPLLEAHDILLRRADGVLPFAPAETES